MGIVDQFARVLVFPLLIGSTVWLVPAAQASTSNAKLSDQSVVANQPYEPPDNGGPDGTIGSGTR